MSIIDYYDRNSISGGGSLKKILTILRNPQRYFLILKIAYTVLGVIGSGGVTDPTGSGSAALLHYSQRKISL